MKEALVLALLLVPFVSAIVAHLTANARSVRTLLALSVVASAILAGMLAVLVHGHGSEVVQLDLGPFPRGLAYSTARAPFLVVATVAFLVIGLAGERRQLVAREARRAIVGLASIVVASLATDFVTLGLVMAVVGAMTVRDVMREDSRPARRDGRLVALVSFVGVAALAIAAVATRGANVLAPLATDLHARLDLASTPLLARDAMVVACAVGLASFPFHFHLPRIVERGSLGVSATAVLLQPTLVVAMHGILPSLGSPSGTTMSVLAFVSVAGAAYTALAALGRTSLPSTLGYLVASQNGIALAGLATRTKEGGVAGVLMSLALALTVIGLLVVSHELESRAGRVSLRVTHGYAKPWPRLGAAFLLLTLTFVGFPGSLQFFAEDLLLQGFLDSHGALAYAVLLIAVLNGITLFRTFFVVFFGPHRESDHAFVARDLSVRAMLGPAAILGAMVGLVAFAPSLGALIER